MRTLTLYSKQDAEKYLIGKKIKPYFYYDFITNEPGIRVHSKDGKKYKAIAFDYGNEISKTQLEFFVNSLRENL